jgi:hypothetical protein
VETTKTADYEIQISGRLHERWSCWFGDIAITAEQQEDRPPLTVFHCPAMDQAKLRGVLNTIWDLNLDLVSVQRLPSGASPPELPDGELITEYDSLVTDMEENDG